MEKITKATYILPDCSVVLVPKLWLKRKSWLKRMKDSSLLLSAYNKDEKKIYIVKEASTELREQQLNIRLAEHLAHSKANITEFYARLVWSGTYKKLVKALQCKSMK